MDRTELCPFHCDCQKAVAEIVRLQAALVSIGILNASGDHYDPEIDKVIREIAPPQQRGNDK